jgi:hypothetical protein
MTLSSLCTNRYNADELKKPYSSIWVGRMRSEISTNAVLTCFVNSEGLGCEDLLDGVVPELAS